MDWTSQGGTMNAWLTIWTQPRATMRAILDQDPKQHVYLLAALGGVAMGVTQLVSQAGEIAKFGAIASYAMIFTVIAVLVLGPLGGILMVWFGSIILHWTGKWIGGKGSREQIMAALAWAQIPSIAMAILILVFLAAYGLVFMVGVHQIPNLIKTLLGAIFVLLLIGVVVWKIYIYFNCLAEAQRFQSAWMAVANSLIAGSIVFAVLIIPLGIMMAVLIPALMNH